MRLQSFGKSDWFLAAGVGLVILSLDVIGASSDFNLSSPRLSPKGNLAFDAKGPADVTGVFEISPNLIDWASAGTFTLTNGSSTLFLQPLDETLFCRTRIAEKDEIPNPASFVAKPNPDFKKTVFLTETGAYLKLRDDNNFTYEVTLGADSLINPDDFTLEVINETSGLPSDELQYLGGIRLSPADISFFGESSLIITVPTGTDLSQIVALAWDRDGSELHITPRSIDGLKITLPLLHSGGFGIARLTGTNASVVLNSLPTDPSRQVEYLTARDQLQLPPSLSTAAPALNHARIQPAEAPPCHSLEVSGIFIQTQVAERLRAALSSDATLEDGLSIYRDETTIVPNFEVRLNEPCNAAVAALVAQTDDLALQALDSSIERAAIHCGEKDLRALIRLLRDIELTKVGHWSSKLSLSRKAHYNELLIQYAKFKLELLSSTAYTTAVGTVRSSVSANFRLQASEIVDDFTIQGSGEFTMDSAAWDNVVSPCTAADQPTPGLLAVNHLYLISADANLNKIIRTDDDIRRPGYGLLFDPFAVTPAENYTLTCEGHTIGLFPSFWGAVFGGFHKDLIKSTPDGRHALFIRDFHNDSDRAPSKRGYQNIGSIAGGDSSETTDITIEFTGGT